MPRYIIVLVLLLAGAPARAQSIEKTDFTAPIFAMSVTVKPAPSAALMASLYSSYAGLAAADRQGDEGAPGQVVVGRGAAGLLGVLFVHGLAFRVEVNSDDDAASWTGNAVPARRRNDPPDRRGVLGTMQRRRRTLDRNGALSYVDSG